MVIDVTAQAMAMVGEMAETNWRFSAVPKPHSCQPITYCI
jgi:hypothetical protein